MHGTNFSIYVVLHHLAREILLHWHGSSVGRKYAVEGMEDIPFYFYLKLINKIKIVDLLKTRQAQILLIYTLFL